MSLPQIALPSYTIRLPSSKKTIKFRPYVTREEKVLLMAMESNDPRQMSNAARDLISACILTSGVNVNTLPPSDLDLLFLNIRAKSVGEIAEIKFCNRRCTKHEAGCMRDIGIDLTKVGVDFPKGHEKKFKITDTIGVEMRYPSADLLDTLPTDGEIDEYTLNIRIAARCIHCVYDEEKVYAASQHSEKELVDFIESLPKLAINKILNFFQTMPQIKHEQTNICPECGDEVRFEATGMADFFGSAVATAV